MSQKIKVGDYIYSKTSGTSYLIIDNGDYPHYITHNALIIEHNCVPTDVISKVWHDVHFSTDGCLETSDLSHIYIVSSLDNDTE